MQEISNFISNVGFPIVACVYMYLQQRELIKSIGELSNTLKIIENKLNSNNYQNIV